MENQKMVIVESPNKIKKIQEILGSGYKVMASVGHVRGLPKTSMGVNRTENYSLDYELDEDKKRVVAGLIAMKKQVGTNNILLATDPDREGEAIAFHLSEILGMDKSLNSRVSFHELTETAIKNAISIPIPINMPLVYAQEARRAIDRLAGFEVSNILNKKLKRVSIGSYSAGRVQSPALKLIVEREKQINAFVPILKYKINASFLTSGLQTTLAGKITASYVGEELSKEDIIAYYDSISTHNFIIESIEKNQIVRNPLPPFTTSTLQQDAIKKIKWRSKKVMEIAQNLFEQGLITYIRTDSPNLSEGAINKIEQQLMANGKANKFKRTIYTAKANAQEAHEAIRPTNFDFRSAGETDEQKKLYALIYLRAIASQMTPAIYNNLKIVIKDSDDGKIFVSNKKILFETGFLEIYNDIEGEGEDFADSFQGEILGEIKLSDTLLFEKMVGKGTFSNPTKRFDEAGLVKTLEEKGIGRPSTYATILNNIIAIKNYAVEGTIAAEIREVEVLTIDHLYFITKSFEKQSVGGDKNKLIPSESGIKIIEFLNTNFQEMMDYEFTSKIEIQLDEITEGKSNYLAVMKVFDTAHCKSLKECGILADLNEKKTSIIGEIEGKPVSFGKSEKGSYLVCNSIFYKLKDEGIPSLEKAKNMIKSITENREKSIIHKIGHYTVKNGQYGFYVEDSKKNMAPLKNFSEEQIKKLSEKAISEKIKNYLEWKKKQKEQEK